MKVAVIGCGIVGSAVAGGLERLGHDVFRHDPAKYSTTVDEMLESKPEICFISVPTPQDDDGSCNTSIVESVIQELVGRKYNGIIVIKSTVEPGFTDRMQERHYYSYLNRDGTGANLRLKLAFVPEFLREAHAFHDFTEGHDVCVIGIPRDAPFFLTDSIIDELKRVHGRYPKSFHTMGAVEAELVKYFSNVFNAARITFANGFYEVCKKLGANYDQVKSAMVDRPTITDMYLDCNENWRGFAGPCLPKDTSAFAALADKLGVEAQIFRTIVEDNKLYRPTVPEGMRLE